MRPQYLAKRTFACHQAVWSKTSTINVSWSPYSSLCRALRGPLTKRKISYGKDWRMSVVAIRRISSRHVRMCLKLPQSHHPSLDLPSSKTLLPLENYLHEIGIRSMRHAILKLCQSTCLTELFEHKRPDPPAKMENC